MFSSKKQEAKKVKKPVALDKADIKAFLGPGSRFEGKLSFDELVRLDGVFSGEICSTDTLIVGETAEIDGSIDVGALILSGRFKGGIKAATLVDLRAPAQVEGTIEATALKIEENVVFNGEIKMVDSKKTITELKIKEEKKK
ncbi:protein CcmA, bactofilin family [Desulfuromusa kysingii]|uniref:Protein CcmA, bactofilin family n=1 Tax=Desulfuromusa kysingii TaxID=37625 RepID=A0A1H4AKU4_9BACT|nr:polymer-forming cytoskeletal protein [Desulfuromusa kysingii]SEA36398.1 protein CcmA, bactofilin family [Desulfuromusa kysingii]